MKYLRLVGGWSGGAGAPPEAASGLFPTTAGAYQTNFTGSQDAFVTRLSASGATLAYSTFLGGSATQSGKGIALDGSGNAYMAGWTTSSNFPTASPFQSSLGGLGATNAFVSELGSSGGSLPFSTYLGGSSTDQANGIALDEDANIYVTGQATSGDFPTRNAYQSSNGGSSDAFVARFTQVAAPSFTGIDSGATVHRARPGDLLRLRRPQPRGHDDGGSGDSRPAGDHLCLR